MVGEGRVLEAVQFLQERMPRLINAQDVGASRAIFSRLLRKPAGEVSDSQGQNTWHDRVRLFEKILKSIDYQYKQPDDRLEDLVPI